MPLMSVSSRRVRAAVASALLVAGISAAAVSHTSASSGGSVQFRIRDNCDAASFNAAIGPGTCSGDGNTTFAEFVAALSSGGHAKWRFQPDSTEVAKGTAMSVVNRGGEAHTFTEVVNFGIGGLVDVLDSSQPPGTPQAIPVGGFESIQVVPPGMSAQLGVLAPGTHLFQCMIHPWMRSTVTVKHR